jgi:hypothetical protein
MFVPEPPKWGETGEKTTLADLAGRPSPGCGHDVAVIAMRHISACTTRPKGTSLSRGAPWGQAPRRLSPAVNQWRGSGAARIVV